MVLNIFRKQYLQLENKMKISLTDRVRVTKWVSKSKSERAKLRYLEYCTSWNHSFNVKQLNI